MDVKRHNGNVLPKKPRTLVRGFLIFHGYACCATKTGKSPSSDTEAWDELLDTWMDDADIVYDKDLITSVGKDYVKE